ncbi:MAG: hypothetical protein A2Z46_03085 [Nitrospirae bacterium RBG_19FT_COMBO_55_12]|nr:MAG: hypothetical protein A2Z46_03085 [Nitrospirae bacterium RBG_19FT_COMBO_55_12]
MKWPDRQRASRSSLSLLLCIMVLALFAARASGQQDRTTKEGSGLVWPLPPDEPKIRYIGAVGGTLDVEKGKGIAGKFVCSNSVDAVQKPYAVDIGENGRLYVTGKGRALVFDPKSGEYGCLGDTPGAGKLISPAGIAVSRDNRIFIADIAAHRVFVYASDGRFARTIGEPDEFDAPSGVVIDEGNKKLYIIDSKKHRVHVYALDDYKLIRTIGSRGLAENGKFNFPTNGAVDSKGNLYIVDTGNFRVQVFDKNGGYVRSLGNIGDVPGSFARPKGIAVDSEDHLYVVDAAFQNVQIFDAEGRLLLFFGTGGWGPGYFTLPAGIAVDSDDKIYIVDQWPGNVQVFQYTGERYQQRQARELERKEKTAVTKKNSREELKP